MILTFADHDGDPVAIDSATIVGLSVGRITGPRDARTADEAVVTLIWASGISQPFMVAQELGAVLDAWEQAREQARGSGRFAPFAMAYPKTIGWEQQYTEGAR